jgi:hypothetical protein
VVADPLSRPELKIVSKIPLRAPALAVDAALFAGDCVPRNVDAGDAVVVCWAVLDPPPPQANEANAQRAIKTSNAYFISKSLYSRIILRQRGSPMVTPGST